MFTDVSLAWDSVMSLEAISSVSCIPSPKVEVMMGEELSSLFNPLSFSSEQRVNAFLALQGLAYGEETIGKMRVTAEKVANNDDDFARAICGFASFLSGPPGTPACPPDTVVGYSRLAL